MKLILNINSTELSSSSAGQLVAGTVTFSSDSLLSALRLFAPSSFSQIEVALQDDKSVS